MPKLLSDDDYQKVVIYKRDMQMSNVAIADELGIRRQTVATILKRVKKNGKPGAGIAGRKKKTKFAKDLSTAEENDRLREESVSNPFLTPRVLKQRLNLGASLPTIKRRLRQFHLHGRRAACKTFLTEQTKERRLNFCKENKKTDWKRVMFTDEVTIQTTKHGMNWVRRPRGARHQARYIRQVNRQGRCKLNVWGAITRDEIFDLVIIDGNQNHQNYIENMLGPIVRTYHDTHPNMIYQHDGAGPHRANTVVDWLRRNEIETLDWPARSPDLNIIENLWNLLKDEVGPLNHIGPNDKNALIEHVNEAWGRIQNRPQLLRKLYASAGKRILDCITAKGAWTRY